MDGRSFWEKFSFEYTLDASILFRDLVSIEAYRQASLNLVLAPEWRAQLDKLNRVRAVYGTTALEGNPLSEAEVSYQIDVIEQEEDTRLQGRLTKEQLQIRNATWAQDWIRERCQPESSPLALGDILTVHRLVTEHSYENNNVPGGLRTGPIQVGAQDVGGIHYGAPYGELPGLMQELVEFVNSKRMADEHPVVRALLAHFFLVTIHPFGDGNGRVSRLLEAGILFQGDYNVHGFYGLSNFFYRNERDYKMLLQECRKSYPLDVAPFVLFGVRGFASELAAINNFIKTKVNRVVYRQMLVSNYNKLAKAGGRRRLLNGREYQLLVYLLNQTEPVDPFSEEPSEKIELSELIESDYVQAAYRDVTPRTFVRELSRLAEFGFIKFADYGGPSQVGTVELDFGAIAKYQVY